MIVGKRKDLSWMGAEPMTSAQQLESLTIKRRGPTKYKIFLEQVNFEYVTTDSDIII